MRYFAFEPVPKQRVWGGRDLEHKLGRKLPQDGQPYGESWEVVDRQEENSVIRGHALAGNTLREALRRDPDNIMGPGWPAERPFPILVKWLDCQQRLSLQVHPPAEIAPKLGGEPKTECWYIAEATENAALIVGLKHGVDRPAFEQAIHDEILEPLLHRFPVEPGDSMLLEAGRLHAIDAGNLILEIQQNSDTTYRVYDWGRKGLDGKPRDLHVEESLQSIDFEDFEPQPRPPFTDAGEAVIADCAEFRIRQLNLAEGRTLNLTANQEPRIVSIVSGRLADDAGNRYERGDNALIPYACTTRLTAQTEARLLITDRFV